MIVSRRRAAFVGVASAGAVALAAACGSTHPASPADDAGADTGGGPVFGPGPAHVDPFDPDAAVPARVNALFGTTCNGGPEQSCHNIGNAGLFLRLGANGDVVNVPSTEKPDEMRVRPFDPDASYLYAKVIGLDGGTEGGRMPLGAPDDDRIPALILGWIEAGAPSP
jgi:hypothetical protein